MRGTSLLRAAALAVAATLAGAAHAQDGAQLEQFEPRAPGSGILNVATPPRLPLGGVGVGLSLSYADDPLALRPVAPGDPRAGGTLIDSSLRVELLGAVGVWHGVELSVAAPVELGGDEGDFGVGGRSAADLAGAGLGDVRLGLAAAPGRWLWGDGLFDLGVELTAWLPTGSTARLAGEGGLRLEPRLLLALGEGRWRLAADVGWHLRERSTVFTWVNDSGPRWRAGFEAPTPWQRLDVIGSVFGAHHLAEQPDPLDVQVTRATTDYDPVEALGALRLRLPAGLVVQLGGGAGLTGGVGAPAWRVVAGLGWVHPAPAVDGGGDDTDGDGIDDIDDLCPTAPERANGIRDADGCPEAGDLSPLAALAPGEGLLADADGDGIADEIDRCPTAPEDLDGFEDGDGCPDPDDDGDGVLDGADRCPRVAGDVEGCPVVGPDADGDRVGDADDRCPLEPETWDGVRDDDGCPERRFEGAPAPLWASLPALPGLGDADGDGIADADDACPDVAEDLDGFGDGDGCPEPDQDGDGIADAVDRCPAVAETLDGFQDDDGCPDLGPDGDGDGVADAHDVCPLEPEVPDGVRDDDGCPEGAPPDAPAAPPVVARQVLPPLAPVVDLDGDGLVEDDACPTAAEDVDGFEDGDGCPDLDDDGDGIPDAVDACPRVAETVNFYNDDDGCPDVAPGAVAGLAGVVESIQFKVGRSDLRPSAMPVLRRVAGVMRRQPRLRLQIDGHTDSTGERERNFVLSNDRAAAVRAWLIAQGIAAERLSSFGYGPDRPAASNADLKGRYQNRRVELSYSEAGGVAP